LGQEWRSADTYGRQFSSFMQSAYAVLGLLAIVALLWRRAWARFLLWLWAATMLLTAATAPVIWAEAGWKPALLALAVTAVIAAVVLWLAPLLPRAKGAKLWVSTVVALAGLCALTMAIPAIQYAPVIAGAKQMEGFCAGLREDLNPKQLADLAATEGYKASDRTDKKGPFVRLDDPANPGKYRCEIRYKDGKLDSVNFTAGPEKAAQPSR
jgi:hypothetical protein